MIRVDIQVYEILLARKHELEREGNESRSLNDAVRDLLHLDQ